MTTPPPKFEYLVNLYNGRSAIAERVDRVDLQNMHVTTKLDHGIQRWIQKGLDVILTGSPGDGKTHLIEYLTYHALWVHQGLAASALIERDASQKQAIEILEAWRQQKEKQRPFVIAINHAPLRALSQEANGFPALAHLTRIPDVMENMICYNGTPESLFPDHQTKVVDLSQRELMTSDILKTVCENLCGIIKPCVNCPSGKCPVEYNAAALQQEKIRQNLFELLSLVTRRGFHTTMRDLMGLIAFMLTGGVTCSERWKARSNDEGDIPEFDDYTYYNLLFEGRSDLFEAIRTTFDPGNYSEPQSDMRLWSHRIQKGWLVSPPVTAPATLRELRRLKRRYFFEHDHDTEVLLRQMLPPTEAAFNDIVTGKREAASAVEDLIEMINLLYAPTRHGQDYRLRLRLWNSHRYARSNKTPVYFAMRWLVADKLTLYYPSLHPDLEGAIEVRRDHVLLGVQEWLPGDPSLRVDWELYQALAAAERGTPIEMQPSHLQRRLDLFLRSLGQDAGGPRTLETVEWSDHQHRIPLKVRVNRQNRTYESS